MKNHNDGHDYNLIGYMKVQNIKCEVKKKA